MEIGTLEMSKIRRSVSGQMNSNENSSSKEFPLRFSEINLGEFEIHSGKQLRFVYDKSRYWRFWNGRNCEGRLEERLLNEIDKYSNSGKFPPFRDLGHRVNALLLRFNPWRLFQ